MNILILGNSSDAHAAHLRNFLIQAAAKVDYLDTRLFPTKLRTSAQFLRESHLDPKRLSLVLSLAPVTIQQYIPGTNIRSYVIGESVYSAEIRSNSLDFREDLQAELIPVELPESVQQQCIAITKALMLDWTAIDWRLSPQGEYVFLEANPSPMFLHFERQTNFPITEHLLRLLMN